jgi:hypothetical protein
MGRAAPRRHDGHIHRRAADRSIGHLLATLGLLDEADAASPIGRPARTRRRLSPGWPLAPTTGTHGCSRTRSAAIVSSPQICSKTISVTRNWDGSSVPQAAAHLEIPALAAGCVGQLPATPIPAQYGSRSTLRAAACRRRLGSGSVVSSTRDGFCTAEALPGTAR